MLPVVTPSAMAAIDAAAEVPLDILIERAGWAAASSARSLMGSVSGLRVLVLAGPGNNGADGRVAARVLERWGAKVTIVDARSWRTEDVAWSRPQLIIDAGFGTGLRRRFDAPDLTTLCPQRPQVLAIDIPSGLDGELGIVHGSVIPADATITFGAYKPGLLVGDGPGLAGRVTVAPLGLDTSNAPAHLLEAGDLAAWPGRSADAHKWRSAVWVIGGRPSMPGAPRMAVMAAGRSGAGYVLGSIPGLDGAALDLPIEAVGRALGLEWGSEVARQADRVAAFVLGPGLPVDDRVGVEVRHCLASIERPMVVDAGAIDAVAVGGVPAAIGSDRASCLRDRSIPAVLTPHDGEFERLMGEKPGPDRLRSARLAAESYRSIVLLKGPTTVVAAPDGRVLLSRAGDARLATAGTGDVLSGIIAAGLALGLDPFMAAGLGAELHGRAASSGYRTGLIASDLPELVAGVLSSIAAGESAEPIDEGRAR